MRCWKRSEEHTSELQSRENLVCRLLLEKKKKKTNKETRLTRSCHSSPVLCSSCWYRGPRDLHSFPTRRSSDLAILKLERVANQLTQPPVGAVGAVLRNEDRSEQRATRRNILTPGNALLE